MNRITDYDRLKTRIVDWIKDYTTKHNIKSLVVGVSGGIDSSVVSILCAETGLPTYVLSLPISQHENQHSLSVLHQKQLAAQYPNVVLLSINLTSLFKFFVTDISTQIGIQYVSTDLSLANSKSRLRMVTLYQIAANVGGIVVGTGNKVEDYGIGFYTKYGDGGVDIAPIADLYKTEVRELGKHLGVDQQIIEAAPTDGLWSDGRTDEDQIGTSYENLEWVMDALEDITPERQKALEIFLKFNTQNRHKMIPIPTFRL